jgi:hypothetical protein
MRISRPSTGTILGAIAVFIALGGTAVAATGTVVNIADPTTATHKAKVDATGALRTAGTATVSGYVGQAIPASPFFGNADLLASGPSAIIAPTPNTLIAANKATVALTRVLVENYYANSAAVDIRLYERSGNTTTCDGSSGSAFVGSYDLAAPGTVSDAMESPVVLKPLVSGDVWCLVAYASIGTNGQYFTPEVSFSGYVAAGTLPAGAVASPRSTTARPRRVAR